MITSSSTDSDSRANMVNPNDVLEVSPLRVIAGDPSKMKKLRTSHARRSQNVPTGNSK